MKKLILKTVLILVLPVVGLAQIKLEKQSILDNKVELSIPTLLKPMSQKMIDLKYPNMRLKPDMILSDEDATINLIIAYTNQPVEDEQIGQYKDFQLDALKKSRPDMQLIKGEVKTINGRPVGYFKFVTQAIDQKVFNCYFFVNVKGRLLLCTFNCIQKLQAKWDISVDEIINSLVVK